MRWAESNPRASKLLAVATAGVGSAARSASSCAALLVHAVCFYLPSAPPPSLPLFATN